MNNPRDIFHPSKLLAFAFTGVFCFLTKDHYLLIQEPCQLLCFLFRNYVIFMGVILAFKLLATLGKNILTNKSLPVLPQDALLILKKTSAQAESVSILTRKQSIIHLCKLIVCYSLLFACFQVVFTLLPESSPLQDTTINLEISQSSRNLEEVAPESSPSTGTPEKLILSPYLNPGEILNSIPLGPVEYSNGVDLIISKDGKTLYTLMNFTLVIHDISDPKKPMKLGSLNHVGAVGTFLMLSPNEDLLYTYTGSHLAIFNVTGKSSPSEIIEKQLEAPDVNRYFSMVLSSDGKTLYTVRWDCLRIWNVSNPKKLTLIHEGYSDPEWSGVIAISKNDTRLAIGCKTGFQIFDVENPKEPIRYDLVETKGFVYSIAFSHDETKLFLGVDHSQFDGVKIFDFHLDIFDITDIDSPNLLLSRQFHNESLTEGRVWLHSNEKYAFFNTKHELRMMSILEGEQTTLFSTHSDVLALPFTASSDNRINVAYFSGAIHIMKFNIDVTPDIYLDFKPNALKVIDEVDYDRRRVMEISKDEEHLFLVRINTTTYPTYGEIIPYERKSCASFEKLNPSSHLEAGVMWDIDDDGRWIFIPGKNISLINYVPNIGSNLFLLNTTNKSQSYQFANIKYNSVFERIPAVALTHDERILIFINHTDNDEGSKTLGLNIMTWDQQKKLIPLVKNFNMPFSLCSPLSLMKTNQNDGLLFYINCDLLIYNIKDPSAPILESSLDLNLSKAHSFILSKDEKTLYLFGSKSGQQELTILNISDPKSPRILSTTAIEQPSSSSISAESIELNSDETILFIGFLEGMLMVDVRNSTKPVLFGFNHFLDQVYAPRFTDNTSMLYSLSHKGVTAYDFSSHYIVYMQNQEFKIGGSYSVLLNVLKLNENLKFDFMIKKHKFLKVTLFELSGTSYSALPNWITFDKERSLLKFEPNSPINNTYKISVTLSTQTQPSAFIGLNNSILTLEDAEDLMLDLTRSGYLDNQGYISEDFDITQALRIDRQYKPLEKDIRAILSKSYIQAIGEISVVSSLKLLETKPLKISTLSKNTIYVTIQLNQEKGIIPRFLSTSHSSLKPLIDNKKSVIRFEGLLEDVNEALREIVVDLNGTLVSNGEISILDGINPPISLRIPSLSNYLSINDKPINNLNNLQAQIDFNPFYTGLYSSYDINTSTFTDKNHLPLEYSLELEHAKLGLPPAWITLRGLTLMATPPESYTKYNYKFVLRVSNEFQYITVPFTLKVKFSFYYAMKLAATFFGYTISLIGFIYSMNKAYNVLARKYYRHPRSFKLKVGEEITDSKVFSVSFINNEMGKFKNIFKTLEKYVTQNYSIPLLECFIDSQSQILDKEKLIETLDSLKNEHYNEADSFSRRIIQQLVINRIVMKQLTAKQNAPTKDVFNKIKNKWMDLVIVSPSAPSQFVINSENLAEELSRFSLGYGGESLDETHYESSDLLIKKNKLNMDLLANAILSYAFEFQNINIDLILIDVISYKRVKGKSLYHFIKKLLLKNLKPFAFLNKREIGCGIEYRTENNTLHFFGKLTQELKNDTIVVHLKNNRGRILREFWINGENTEIQLQNYQHNNVSEAL